MKKSSSIRYLDRLTGTVCTETVMGDGALRFAYETALGRSLWAILFGGKFLSSLMGRYYDSSFSRRAVSTLTSLPGCMPEEAEKRPEEYSSFNAFFTRRLKPGARPVAAGENIVVSPADGRFSLYPASPAQGAIPVKGAKRTLAELCRLPLPDVSYDVAVIRLSPVDYHRFHFPCSCTQAEDPICFAGKYHSVNPIALRRRPDLYVENTRQITVLTSPSCGTFYMIEVGAFGVGSIVQTAKKGNHAKMEEKGFFTFGGSTVLLIFPHGTLTFDADLLRASADGMEVLLRCGMQIAVTSR